MATTTRRRDVEAFERLLWQWFDAQNEIYFVRTDPNQDHENLAEAESMASAALDAVLKAFEAEPDDARPQTQQPLPPQNSRDSDFP